MNDIEPFGDPVKKTGTLQDKLPQYSRGYRFEANHPLIGVTPYMRQDGVVGTITKGTGNLMPIRHCVGPGFSAYTFSIVNLAEVLGGNLLDHPSLIVFAAKYARDSYEAFFIEGCWVPVTHNAMKVVSEHFKIKRTVR